MSQDQRQGLGSCERLSCFEAGEAEQPQRDASGADGLRTPPMAELNL